MLVERRLARILFAKILTVLVGLAAASAHAVNVTDLYEVTVPIEASRDTAFVEALKAVAVRVSGQRDAGSRLGASANSPRQYAQQIRFTADNQLQVAFDSGSVDKLLSDAGLSIWGRERPATLVLLSVTGPDGAPMWLEGSYPSGDRETIARAARQRGLPLVWPTLSSEDRSVLSQNPPSATALTQLAARHNANAALVGHARRDASGSHSVRWTLATEEGLADASGALDEGVHLAADTFTRMFAASGATLGTVSVELAGIDNLDDYASALNYLEGVTLVRSVSVEQVAGGTLRLQLAVRGDAATLRRALALDNKLVPSSAAADAPADRLQLRLRR